MPVGSSTTTDAIFIDSVDVPADCVTIVDVKALSDTDSVNACIIAIVLILIDIFISFRKEGGRTKRKYTGVRTKRKLPVLTDHSDPARTDLL